MIERHRGMASACLPLVEAMRYLDTGNGHHDGEVATADPVEVEESQSALQRVTNGICRRSFSSPEAVAYEMTIAPALAKVVGPVVHELVTGSPILDVGCGGGRLAISVAERLSAAVVGLDPSLSQVRRLSRRRRNVPGVEPVRARVEDLPFGESVFDSVFSSCAWKHWPDPVLGLAECVRVTRPGGVLVVVEIDGSSSAEEFRRFAYASRVPVGLREAYVRFAMRTVVGVAPDSETLAHSFAGLNVRPPTVSRIADLPFLVAATTTLCGRQPILDFQGSQSSFA
jgi:SAM-dependent methyltransferase